MKITAVLNTISRVAGAALGSRIDRTAHESIEALFTSPHTRVGVIMKPDGSALVMTFRLATGGIVDDKDSWIEGPSIIVPVGEKHYVVAAPVDCAVLPILSEALPY